MRTTPAALTVCLLLSFGASTAQAAAPLSTRPVVGHVAVGYAAPLGEAADFFAGGWSASAGATFHFSPTVPVGLRLDLGYARFDATNQILRTSGYPLAAQVDDGHLSTGHLSVDAVWEFGGSGHVGGFVAAGIAGFRRHIEITRTVLAGSIDCDPLSSICIVSGAGDVIDDDDRSTLPGFDAGAGIRFAVGQAGELYLEARYLWMASEPATAYVPVVAGFRF
jgi:opacity protein-like surface antigen